MPHCLAKLVASLDPLVISNATPQPADAGCQSTKNLQVAYLRGAAMEKAAAASARLRTTLLMNLASVVEKADEQVLPAVYYFIGRSLNATPAQLGTLTLCRALVQASPSCMQEIQTCASSKLASSRKHEIACCRQPHLQSAACLVTSTTGHTLWHLDVFCGAS